MVNNKKQTAVENDLLQHISLLNATLESVTDGILVVNTERSIVKYNNKFIEMWRIPQEVMETKNDETALFCVLDQLIDSDGFLEKVNMLYSTPTAESFDTLNFKDGRVYERYSRAQYLGNQVVGRVWSFRDVTEKKNAAEALKMSKERLNSAAKAANFGVYSYNFKTERTFYSSEFLRLLGLPAESKGSTHDLIIDAIHPDDKSQYIHLLKESNDPNGSGIFEHEYRIILPGGGIRWLKMIGRTVFMRSQPHDQPLFSNGVILDISGRKFADIKFKQAYDDLEQRVLERTAQLEKTNTTLSMMLNYAQKTEEEIQERVVANLRTNILSVVDALKKQPLTNTVRELVKTLETTTHDLAHPLAKRLDSPLLKLTPREIQLANLIRLGKSTKEIMNLLNISEKTIETHRNRLRKKLGISHTGTNLRTFLSSEILK